MWLLDLSTTFWFTLHSAPNRLITSESQIGIVENPLYVDEEMVETSSGYSAAASQQQDYDEKPQNAVSFDFGQAKPE